MMQDKKRSSLLLKSQLALKLTTFDGCPMEAEKLKKPECKDKTATKLLKAIHKKELKTVTNLVVKGSKPADLSAADDTTGDSALHYAVDSGSKEMVELLLSKGASVDLKNKGGLTPLAFAVKRNVDVAIVDALLNAKPMSIDSYDSQNKTPLYYAIQIKSEAIFQKLLDAGADTNKEVSTAGNSYMHETCAVGFLKGTAILLKRGITPNSQHKTTKNTPLHVAALNGHMGCVSALLGYGANKELVNHNNSTPAQMAISGGHSDISNAISRYTADPNAPPPIVILPTPPSNTYAAMPNRSSLPGPMPALGIPQLTTHSSSPNLMAPLGLPRSPSNSSYGGIPPSVNHSSSSGSSSPQLEELERQIAELQRQNQLKDQEIASLANDPRGKDRMFELEMEKCDIDEQMLDLEDKKLVLKAELQKARSKNSGGSRTSLTGSAPPSVTQPAGGPKFSYLNPEGAAPLSRQKSSEHPIPMGMPPPMGIPMGNPMVPKAVKMPAPPVKLPMVHLPPPPAQEIAPPADFLPPPPMDILPPGDDLPPPPDFAPPSGLPPPLGIPKMNLPPLGIPKNSVRPISPMGKKTTLAPAPLRLPSKAPTVPTPAPTTSDDSLPEGWEKMVDPKGRVFYVDHNTQQTHWDPPPRQRGLSLPPPPDEMMPPPFDLPPPPMDLAPPMPSLKKPMVPVKSASPMGAPKAALKPSKMSSPPPRNNMNIEGLEIKPLSSDPNRRVQPQKKGPPVKPRASPQNVDTMIPKLAQANGIDTNFWMDFEKNVLSEIRQTVEEVDPIQWLMSIANGDDGYSNPDSGQDELQGLMSTLKEIEGFGK